MVTATVAAHGLFFLSSFSAVAAETTAAEVVTTTAVAEAADKAR